MNPSGKPVALVTGSSRKRVGWHVADALAAHGYDIVVHYRTSAAAAADTVRHLESKGAQAIALAADLSNQRAVRELVGRAMERFGQIDALVNCAGAWQMKRLEEITDDDVRGMFEVNTLGTFLCSQQVGLTMVKQPEGGCIVTVGDWAVARPYLHYAAYFPSKGAIGLLTIEWLRGRQNAHQAGKPSPKLLLRSSRSSLLKWGEHPHPADCPTV